MEWTPCSRLVAFKQENLHHLRHGGIEDPAGLHAAIPNRLLNVMRKRTKCAMIMAHMVFSNQA